MFIIMLKSAGEEEIIRREIQKNTKSDICIITIFKILDYNSDGVISN